MNKPLNHNNPAQQIRQELLDSQLKVASLQDMSLQLLVNSQGSDCLEAKEKVHVIGNRLKLLLKEVTRDLRELAKILDITSSQQVRTLAEAANQGQAKVFKCLFCFVFSFNFLFPRQKKHTIYTYHN